MSQEMGREGKWIKIANPASQKHGFCFLNMKVFSERNTEDYHRGPMTEGDLKNIFENPTLPKMYEGRRVLADLHDTASRR